MWRFGTLNQIHTYRRGTSSSSACILFLSASSSLILIPSPSLPSFSFPLLNPLRIRPFLHLLFPSLHSRLLQHPFSFLQISSMALRFASDPANRCFRAFWIRSLASSARRRRDLAGARRPGLLVEFLGCVWVIWIPRIVGSMKVCIGGKHYEYTYSIWMYF